MISASRPSSEKRPRTNCAACCRASCAIIRRLMPEPKRTFFRGEDTDARPSQLGKAASERRRWALVGDAAGCGPHHGEGIYFAFSRLICSPTQSARERSGISIIIAPHRFTKSCGAKRSATSLSTHRTGCRSFITAIFSVRYSRTQSSALRAITKAFARCLRAR